MTTIEIKKLLEKFGKFSEIEINEFSKNECEFSLYIIEFLLERFGIQVVKEFLDKNKKYETELLNDVVEIWFRKLKNKR